MSEVVSLTGVEALTELPDSFVIDEETYVRRIVPADAEVLTEVIDANQDVREYITWASLVHGPADVVRVLQKHSTTDSMVGRYAYVHHDAVVGYLGIFPGQNPDEYGFGYFLDAPYRGRGYVTKGVQGLLEIAQNTLGANQFYLLIAPENDASLAVAARLNFQPTDEMFRDEALQKDEQFFRLEVDNG